MLARLALAVVLLPGALAAATLVAATVVAQTPTPEAGEEVAERDSIFRETMDGARLVGKFTVDGATGTSAPQDDLYSISKLEKGEGDTWIFSYSMSYGGGQAMTVPIPVRVVWADDTPMLTMSDQAVTGLGSFTVRVLIHGDRYAGTWSAGPRGGHMWGRIEREGESDAATSTPSEPAATPPG
jgi:hypothetical protein